MPSFKNSLSEDQIHSMVFLRSLAASKEIGRTLYTAVVATGNGFSSFGREAVEKGGSS